MRTVTRTFSAPARIGLDLIAIPEGAQVDLDLTLQSVSEGVLVSGEVNAPLEGECVRCLEPFEDLLTLSLTELFAYPDSTTEQTTEEDEIPRVVDDHIDLEPVIIDAVGLALPLQPLCSPDCLGLCSECGVRLAIAGSDHRHETMDPRWAGLAAKFGSGSASTEPETRAEDARLDPTAEEK
nr:YceD family protein [Aldersonia kunmingensis]